MEERNKEFEEKIKVEYNKLTREKKYMKDIQLAGKGDSKLKMENSELRKGLEEVKEEKKRMEVKLKGEIERLKRKLE
jgi:regulator of replication initiation timing